MARETREWCRRRAVELDKEGWEQQEIADALGCTQGTVSRWLKLAGESMLNIYLDERPGRPRQLTWEQLGQLTDLLDQGAEAHGFRGDVWTTKRTLELIDRKFGVYHDPSHVGRLLKQIGYSVQKPARRAKQRDEQAILHFKNETGPALKKKP